MIPASSRRIVVLICAATGLASCGGAAATSSGPRTVQPGAPGEATRVIAPGEGRVPGHTAADARFMQGMIAHHAQAVEMSALVFERTEAEDVRQLARRIDISQRDEIALMQRWLADRGEAAPDASSHMEHGDGTLMPGMLTAEMMQRLAAASGVEFEKLFLAGMIRHHEGALVMVKELFASTGAGQEPEIFRFAADVDTDQRAEIARMRIMLQQRGTE